jgi:hypothetical protein
MKIGIASSVWNSAKEIPRSLKPWIPHVHRVAMVSGRYWTPESPQMKAMKLPKYSTDNTEKVAREVCGDKLIYEELFTEQMKKRQRCFDLLQDCDFAIIMDSDDYIHPDYVNWDKFLGQLESVLKYWDDDLFYQWAWIPDEKLYPRQHNEGIPDNSWKKYVRIHRNPSQMRYTKNHFTWAKKETTDDQINQWNWNPDNWRFDKDLGQKVPKMENPYLLQAHMIIDGIRITTDRIFRDPDQLKYGDGWAWQNMHYETYEYDFKPACKYKGMKIALEDYEYFFDENGMRRTYNKDGSVMTKEQVDKIIKKEEELLLKARL